MNIFNVNINTYQVEYHISFNKLVDVLDVFDKAEEIFYVRKTTSIDVVKYKKNNDADFTTLTFTNNIWEGSINLLSGDVIQWQVEFEGENELGTILIKANK